MKRTNNVTTINCPTCRWRIENDLVFELKILSNGNSAEICHKSLSNFRGLHSVTSIDNRQCCSKYTVLNSVRSKQEQKNNGTVAENNVTHFKNRNLSNCKFYKFKLLKSEISKTKVSTREPITSEEHANQHEKLSPNGPIEDNDQYVSETTDKVNFYTLFDSNSTFLELLDSNTPMYDMTRIIPCFTYEKEKPQCSITSDSEKFMHVLLLHQLRGYGMLFPKDFKAMQVRVLVLFHCSRHAKSYISASHLTKPFDELTPENDKKKTIAECKCHSSRDTVLTAIESHTLVVLGDIDFRLIKSWKPNSIIWKSKMFISLEELDHLFSKCFSDMNISAMSVKCNISYRQNEINVFSERDKRKVKSDFFPRVEHNKNISNEMRSNGLENNRNNIVSHAFKNSEEKYFGKSIREKVNTSLFPMENNEEKKIVSGRKCDLVYVKSEETTNYCNVKFYKMTMLNEYGFESTKDEKVTKKNYFKEILLEPEESNDCEASDNISELVCEHKRKNIKVKSLPKYIGNNTIAKLSDTSDKVLKVYTDDYLTTALDKQKARRLTSTLNIPIQAQSLSKLIPSTTPMITLDSKTDILLNTLFKRVIPSLFFVSKLTQLSCDQLCQYRTSMIAEVYAKCAMVRLGFWPRTMSLNHSGKSHTTNSSEQQNIQFHSSYTHTDTILYKSSKVHLGEVSKTKVNKIKINDGKVNNCSGGLVLPVIPTVEAVAVFDYFMLYPSIIYNFNINMATVSIVDDSFLSKLQKQQRSLRLKIFSTGNATNSGTKIASLGVPVGPLALLMKELMTMRKRYATKNNALHFSAYCKVLANTIAGLLFTNRVTYLGDKLCATYMTAIGRKILQVTQSEFERRGYRVIGGDTDSVFVEVNRDIAFRENHFELLADEVAQAVRSEILSEETVVEDKHVNNKETAPLTLKYEKLFRKFFAFEKKRYTGISWNPEDCKSNYKLVSIKGVSKQMTTDFINLFKEIIIYLEQHVSAEIISNYIASKSRNLKFFLSTLVSPNKQKACPLCNNNRRHNDTSCYSFCSCLNRAKLQYSLFVGCRSNFLRKNKTIVDADFDFNASRNNFFIAEHRDETYMAVTNKRFNTSNSYSSTTVESPKQNQQAEVIIEGTTTPQNNKFCVQEICDEITESKTRHALNINICQRQCVNVHQHTPSDHGILSTGVRNNNMIENDEMTFVTISDRNRTNDVESNNRKRNEVKQVINEIVDYTNNGSLSNQDTACNKLMNNTIMTNTVINGIEMNDVKVNETVSKDVEVVEFKLKEFPMNNSDLSKLNVTKSVFTNTLLTQSTINEVLGNEEVRDKYVLSRAVTSEVDILNQTVINENILHDRNPLHNFVMKDNKHNETDTIQKVAFSQVANIQYILFDGRRDLILMDVLRARYSGTTELRNCRRELEELAQKTVINQVKLLANDATLNVIYLKPVSRYKHHLDTEPISNVKNDTLLDKPFFALIYVALSEEQQNIEKRTNRKDYIRYIIGILNKVGCLVRVVDNETKLRKKACLEYDTFGSFKPMVFRNQVALSHPKLKLVVSFESRQFKDVYFSPPIKESIAYTLCECQTDVNLLLCILAIVGAVDPCDSLIKSCICLECDEKSDKERPSDRRVAINTMYGTFLFDSNRYVSWINV